MYKVILLLLSLSSVAYSCTKFNPELDLFVGNVAQGLFAGNKIQTWEVQQILDEISAMELSEKRKSSGSDTSLSSDNTASSSSSHEAIEEMDKVFDLFFEENYKSKEQLVTRKAFIKTLHSLENTVDPTVLTKAVIMISEKLLA